MFATILYYMVGLADRESAANFFIYLSLLFVFALLMNQQLAVFASFASAGGLNAYGACIVLLLILFSGFIVVPDTIPMYYSWIYWWNRKSLV
jgi:ABC-2 type transporter